MRALQRLGWLAFNVALVYVARHGETEWNREGRYQGQRESALTATGRAQAEALAGAFAGVALDRIVSSPLGRCVETALPLARGHGLHLERDARLIEIAHGDWEGRLRSDIQRDDASTLRAWQQSPADVTFRGGESLENVRDRWDAFIQTLDGKSNVMVVTHDVVVRIAILVATGQPLDRLWEPRVINGGYATFAHDDGRLSLRDECADRHLEGLLVDTAQQAL